MRGLFITRTDTPGGKTLITAAIAPARRPAGRSFRVCKPVATGSVAPSEEARLLAAAAGDDPALVTPFTFPAPAAPPVAARAAGRSLSLEHLLAAVAGRADRDALLIEGVGGLLC